MFKLFQRSQKVILVLGGGSARGLAHIGVLKVLQREQIPIDMIVGTSMGAFVGAAYALGVPLTTMEEQAHRFTMGKLLDPTMPKLGLLAGDKLEKLIREMVGTGGFANCRIPLAVVTTDAETGEEVVHQTGDLIKIVRASCSWPGIFNPVRIDGRLLVDGGIKNSVPTKMARELSPGYMVAVDVGFCVRVGRIDTIFQMILQSFQITGEELNKYQSSTADFIVKIDLDGIDQAAFGRSRDIIRIGRETAEVRIKHLKKELGLG